MSIGKTVEFDTMLQQKEVTQNGYTRKNIFDLQFPHYNKFIDYVADRKNEDGVLIAGTYMQYFLKNQWNIKSDGMLSRFREQASDGNGCKTSQRLALNNIKYLVIDPNIGTVGMGEGNESLFQRFFAKLDPISGKIQEDGAMSMLVKLTQEGYLKLFNTNNLGAKYAFTVSDEDIKVGFGVSSQEDIIFTRTKLAIARYFQDATSYISFIGNTFINRIESGKAIGDIADVYGKNIDEEKLFAISKTFTSGQTTSEVVQQKVSELSQDERLILAQYLGIYNIAKSSPDQLQSTVNNIL
ncbi:TPA: hypothetical protein DEP21_00035 [Patescibacteria group bacterium]|nr:hypothetical protein [Candidatus Gracilibacteria bacterium]